MTESGIEKVIKQIEKQVDVIKAFYHTDEETIFQETALYKVKSNSLFEERHIQNSIKESNARIITVNPKFFVIEKTGFSTHTCVVDPVQIYNEVSGVGYRENVRGHCYR